MSKIKVALVGVGNCASSIVQGVQYYANIEREDEAVGLRNLFLKGYHRRCKKYHEMYHNAERYQEYEQKRLFPVSFFQEQIDLATSELMDKLYYKNQPCTLVPRPNVPRGD